jgi:hypothetical protein
VSPLTNQLPVPDPNASRVEKKLLVCKSRLNAVLQQVQRNLDPKKFLKSDFETHMKELERVVNEIDKLMNSPKNKPEIEQLLNSAIAVKEEVSEARRQLWSAVIPLKMIHSSTASIAKQMESAVELDKALEKCREALNVAISQFRI